MHMSRSTPLCHLAGLLACTCGSCCSLYSYVKCCDEYAVDSNNHRCISSRRKQKKARRAKAYCVKRRFHDLQKAENESTIVLPIPISARFTPYRSATRSITGRIQLIWIEVDQIYLWRWIGSIWIAGSGMDASYHDRIGFQSRSSAQCGCGL